MRNAAVHVHGVDPRAVSLVIGREIEERAIANKSGEGHAALVKGHSFRLAPGRPDTPDVALLERQAVHEVNELAVTRPDRKVIVKACRRLVDLPLPARVARRG